MFQFWHDFLYDAPTFGFTILIVVAAIVIGFMVKAAMDLNK